MTQAAVPVILIGGINVATTSGTAFVVADATPTNRFVVDTNTPGISMIAPTTIQYGSPTAFLVRSGVPVTVFSIDTGTPLVTSASPMTVSATSTTAFIVQTPSPTTFFSIDTVNFLCLINCYTGIGTAPLTNNVLTVTSTSVSGNSVAGVFVGAISGGSVNSNGIYITKPTGTGPVGLVVEDAPFGASLVAPTAAGILVAKFGTGGVGLYLSTGTPTVSAAKGSLCINVSATTTTTRLFINTNGSTTWTNFTTAA